MAQENIRKKREFKKEITALRSLFINIIISVMQMLFTKKIVFSVIEKQIKDDLTDENGELLIKLNLRYPEIKCKKNDVLSKHCAGLYPEIANEFEKYARTELKKAVLEEKKNSFEYFVPYSVLMRWENAFESDDYLCIIIDLSVSDGRHPPKIERKIQIWERKFGTKCRFSYFFNNENKKVMIEKYISEDNRKKFDKELFALKKDGFEFHIAHRHGYKTVLVPFADAKNNGFLKNDLSF